MKPRDLFANKSAGRSASAALLPIKASLQRHRHTLLKVSLWVIGVIALFGVIGFFAVPPIAKYYLVKNLSELLDRQVAIERIKVNPFSMTITVLGFSVKEPGKSPETFVS